MSRRVCGECSRSLASRQSLWKHKQCCKVRRDLKAAGKKTVKNAAQHGVKIAKDVGKEVGKDLINTGVDVGTNLALQGLDSLAQKATNKGVPVKLTHSVADHAKRKTLAGATILEEAAKSKLNRLTQQSTVNKKKRKAASSLPKKSKKRKTTGKTLSQLIEQV